MSWNARIRCTYDSGGEYTKGKIYNIKNGKFKDDEGILCANEYRNIDDLNDGFTSQFELVEDATDNNVGNIAKSTDIDLANYCIMELVELEVENDIHS